MGEDEDRFACHVVYLVFAGFEKDSRFSFWGKNLCSLGLHGGSTYVLTIDKD